AHRGAVDVQRAGRLAGRTADAAGELGKGVGAVQYAEGAVPVLAVHQVLDVGDDALHRAAVAAERRAAVHAARPLDPGLRLVQPDDELLVVPDALGRRGVALLDALVFHETRGLAHDACVLW